MKRSECFTLIAEEDDFQIDGFRILRNESIVAIASDKVTEFATKVTSRIGLDERGQAIMDFPLDSYKSVFEGITRLGGWVSIYGESDNVISLGRISSVGLHSVSLRYVSAFGEYGDFEEVAYADILSLAFGDNYLRVLEEWLCGREKEG